MLINEEMEGVEVRYMQRPNKTRFFQVLVRSQVRPHLKKIGEFDDTLVSERRTAQKIGILAGAMAEELCEQYEDTIEPSGAARAAMEAYREMMSEQRGVLYQRDQDA